MAKPSSSATAAGNAGSVATIADKLSETSDCTAGWRFAAAPVSFLNHIWLSVKVYVYETRFGAMAASRIFMNLPVEFQYTANDRVDVPSS